MHLQGLWVTLVPLIFPSKPQWMECVEGFVNNPRNHPHPNSCRVQTSAQLSSRSLGHTFCTLSWSELCSVGGPFKTNPPTREPLAPLNEVSGSQREVSPYQTGSFLPSSALTSRRLNPILRYNRGRGRDAISRIWCTHTHTHTYTRSKWSVILLKMWGFLAVFWELLAPVDVQGAWPK